MFWPAVLPIKITFWLLLAFLVLAIVYAVRSKRTTWKVSLLAIAVSFIAFIPSCMGVGMVLDQYRFGLFHHATVLDVDDFRIERFLPVESQNIDVFKFHSGNGYVARYEINRADLVSYVDGMWEEWGDRSAISRAELSKSSLGYSDRNSPQFADRDWSLDGQVDVFRSPVEGDGGGATYYHEVDTGVTLMTASYW